MSNIGTSVGPVLCLLVGDLLARPGWIFGGTLLLGTGTWRGWACTPQPLLGIGPLFSEASLAARAGLGLESVSWIVDLIRDGRLSGMMRKRENSDKGDGKRTNESYC
mgnify:FL=1